MPQAQSSAAEPQDPEPAKSALTGQTATGPVKGFVATQSGTATKSDTPIIETPRSISVVTRDDIDARGGALSLGDALGYTAGINVQNSVDSRITDTIRIRGFNTFESLYLDGLAVGGGLDRAQPQIEPYGLERIEVLKGPASILYGQSTPGGIVNMVSKRPTTEPLHEVQFQFGSFDRAQFGFDFSDRLDSAGQFSYRLVGLVQDSGAQVDFVDDDRLFIAPSFTWRPDNDTSLTILTHYRRMRGSDFNNLLPIYGTLLDSPYGKIPKDRYTGEPGFDHNNVDQYGIGYSYEKRFNSFLKFTSNYRYFQVDTDYADILFPNLQPGTPFVSRTLYLLDESQTSNLADNRFELKIPSGPLVHKVVVGIDYRNQSNSNQNRYDFWGGPDLNVYDPVYGAPIAKLPFNASADRSLIQTGYYVQDQLSLEGWRLSLGMRHDDATTSTSFGGPADVVNASANTYNAGLLYLFDNGFAPYVSYAESFQPLLSSGITGPLKPITGVQYELGAKYQPPGLPLILTSSIFDLTQSNRLTYNDIVNFFPVQIGEVNIRGFELEARASVGQWDLTAGYTYLTSEVVKSGDADVPIGNEVDVVPAHSFVMWADYKFDATSPAYGFKVGAGIRYNSVYWGDISNTIRDPSSTLFDAAVGYDFAALDRSLKGVRFDLNATNLADDDNIACYTVDQCIYGRGRTFIGTLKYTW